MAKTLPNTTDCILLSLFLPYTSVKVNSFNQIHPLLPLSQIPDDYLMMVEKE
jgi:hypothetical protein